MKNRQKQNYIYILGIFCIVSLLSACDINDPLNIDAETLNIDLQTESQTINIGDTTSITATVDYTGDPTVLIYEWETNGGRIVGEGSNVVYVAPESAGTYTITLEISDGNVTKRENIRIVVDIGNAIVSMPNRYWHGNTFTQSLNFRLNVDKLFRDNISLRYEIIQDAARAGAFLSITINGISVVRNRAIGDVHPQDPVLITDNVDVSSIISSPGNYDLTLTIDVVNVMENAWLLNKITVIGVEGNIAEVQ